MKNFILLLLVLSSSSAAVAQELKRRAYLGVEVENIEGAGVGVKVVTENGSGDRMGIEPNDIILKVAGKPMRYVDEFISAVSGHLEGDKITIVINRDGAKLTLNGGLLGRPMEKPALGSISYGTVEYSGGKLRSLLNLPPNVANPPVVFFIQGYSCRSIDIYWNEHNRLRQIVDGLVAEGFAVFRLEKPGMGDSQTKKECSEIGYHEETAAFLAGLRALKASEKVDSNRVFLFGHSLGGMTAPVIAAQEQVKGIINYGSVTTSWFEFMVKRAREHGRLRNDDPIEVEAHTREIIPFLQDYLIEKMHEADLHVKHVEYLKYHGTPYLAGRDYSFMQELQAVDITQCLTACGAHVLAIHAEADYNCIDDDWAKHTAYIVNKARPNYGQWKLLPETSHSFAKVGDLETLMELRASGALTSSFVDSNFNQALITVIVDWISEVEAA